ncbi:uncharacterized protein Z518_10200 [Rhinocladiella mackenziei CBS 650.93]|uniref:Rhinocladiella mackenziei CBS 650.93 unplaced genomic scaffold supercont1.8, whole genome shotgun sequence n=1 Tax=Rhinocladiella mackenziei CBS 650.93 TaxID=1442369 RepID=A0A0D2I5R4_9EURO|nr:uncharacterized protein Z518_10200 [Rhinocladiella mackenziei CBS 650.93]KIX01134.1 hypothetical protein Z518_10200 [Rhinocladiella mackenziei CBS 650.93]
MEKPWHASFPTPRTTDPDSISREDLLSRFKAGERGGADFLLVDLRRNDHEGGTIRTSLNLPAQTLFPSLSTLHALCVSAKIPLVIFYCGSSRGRGTRAAGWLADFIEEHLPSAPTSGDEAPWVVKSAILQGGIKAWVAGGEEYVSWMDGFEENVWRNSKE